MEDIAAAADVSVATVYNYFGSKTTVLVAGVEDDAETMLEQGARVLATPGTDPRRAVRKLLGIYLQHLTAWDRRLLREVMGAMFQPGGDELASGLAQTDERLIAQLTELLGRFQERSALQPHIAPAEAALLLFSTVVTQLFIFLSLETFTPDELTAQVSRQIDIAFDGLASPDLRDSK
jgi:AcrR family transcriptional regulator